MEILNKKIIFFFDIMKNCFGKGSIVYKENNEDFFMIICKDQTCSKKLKDVEEIKNYLKNL